MSQPVFGDILIHMNTGPNVCLDRIDQRERGLPQRLSNLPRHDVAQALAQGDQLLGSAVEQLLRQDANDGTLRHLLVVTPAMVDGPDRVATLVANVEECLASLPSVNAIDGRG